MSEACGERALRFRVGRPASPRRVPSAARRRAPDDVLAGVHDERDRADEVVVLEVHDAHAGGRAALLGDAAGGGALDHAADADEHQLLVLAHDERAREAALFLGQADRLDAFGAAVGLAVLADLGALAVAVLGDDEQVHVVAGDVHRDHPAVLADVHAAHAGGVAPHRAHVGLGEAHGQAGARDHDDLVVGVDRAHGEQLVVVADVDRDDAVGFDRRVVGEQLGLLDGAVARGEHEVLGLGEVARGDHRLDPLALAQRQHVDERAALGRALRLGQLVDLRAVDLAAVGEEQQVVVRGAHEQVLDEVAVLHVHARSRRARRAAAGGRWPAAAT